MTDDLRTVQRNAVRKLLSSAIGWARNTVDDADHRATILAAMATLPPDFFDEPATISEKVAHVKSATQTRAHHCHWPDCPAQVPPAMWGCKPHWYRLPKPLRDRIWATYRPGQEATATPSAAYVAVAREVQAWIATQAAPKQGALPGVER